MGLDGISVNQLRITPEHNSSELNKVPKFSLDISRAVDGLSEGQRVDPDKERDKEKRELNKQYNSSDDDSNQDDFQNDMIDVADEEITKYDLSQTDKYFLKVNDDTNEILIIDKASKIVVQTIDADSLSNFVNFLSFPQGSIVNRKF